MQDELSKILAALENIIRRNILTKLTKEVHYPLQLSNELGVSQQSIMKHLNVLEKSGLVKSYLEKSKKGPKRKYYKSVKHFSLKIDLSPSFFKTEIQDFRRKEKINDYEIFEKKYSLIAKKEDEKKLKEFSELIEEIDEEIVKIEKKRDYLLAIKDEIISNANRIINETIDDYEEREVLYYILERRNADISAISEYLRRREKEVEEIFEQLAKRRLLWFEE